MAFRRRTTRFRRSFRRRWDMQTFRDCERELFLDVSGASTCNDPQIFADYLCGIGPSTSPQMKAGASRAVMFGGGHLRVRYNAAILHSDQMPCHVPVKVITALAVLPLLENDLTPAYLPNLAIARSQLSVVPATESDIDENLLWWHDWQMQLTNISCLGCDDEDCTVGCSNSGAGGASDFVFWNMKAIDGVLNGRREIDHKVRVKRRLREREALFLLSEFVAIPSSGCAAFTWPIHRNAYMRYAVR